jgi:hypothetical protein
MDGDKMHFRQYQIGEFPETRNIPKLAGVGSGCVV